MTLVVKISGSELDDAAFVGRFSAAIRALTEPVIIVHGGGKEISEMQRRMGIEPRYIDGIRITDAESLVLVEMVLCGTINKRLTRSLIEAGVDALGISGVDRGIVRAQKMESPSPDIDMGFTGSITAVRAEPLREWIAAGVTPVIAPICLGEGTNYNVNADHVAGAVASALGAERLIFLSNVPGVLNKKGKLISMLTPDRVDALIANGTIKKGMIPKVRTALSALESGAESVVIGGIDALNGSGTVLKR
ncbi:MAG: acetylglutamate kinase [Phototrophicales bacterium]|nr:MAG: acetylglutamate kinase [Phototrophicales bacterium]